VLIFVMGLYPKPFLQRMEPSVNQFLADYKTKYQESTTHVTGPPKRLPELAERGLKVREMMQQQLTLSRKADGGGR
jgi:hypothetical protein